MKPERSTVKLNPGSDEAIEQGCTCAVLDNCHGAGFPFRGAVCFYITEDCPIHGNGAGEPCPV